ncbi:hypothetical protein M758_12G112600 [Ceratodon purpureus]|nr:hypothetical protein M758_12G112600 [Ceratodon purpureus]
MLVSFCIRVRYSIYCFLPHWSGYGYCDLCASDDDELDDIQLGDLLVTMCIDSLIREGMVGLRMHLYFESEYSSLLEIQNHMCSLRNLFVGAMESGEQNLHRCL